MRKKLICILTIIAMIASMTISIFADSENAPPLGNCCENPKVMKFRETEYRLQYTHTYEGTSTGPIQELPSGLEKTCEVYKVCYIDTYVCRNCGKEYGKPTKIEGAIVHSGCNQSGPLH